MIRYDEIERDREKLKTYSNPNFATVIESTSKGVKIKKDGEQQAIDTYYNSLVGVNAGDRVYIQQVSGTYLIIGKLQY